MQEYRNIIIKLIVTLFLLVIIGLPINDIINFSLFIFCITVIIFSKILIKKNYFFYFIILSILFSAYSFIPTLKIHEEHNIIILNEHSKSFYKDKFPKDFYEIDGSLQIDQITQKIKEILK